MWIKTSISFRENGFCIILPLKGLFKYLPPYTFKLQLQIGLNDLETSCLDKRIIPIKQWRL